MRSLKPGTYKKIQIASPFSGAPVFFAEETGSTMADAELLLEGSPLDSGAVSGMVLAAGYQTAGIGRMPGRRWNAGAGASALFTMLLHRKDFRLASGLFPLLAGLAYCYYLESVTGMEPKIKWPNDVLLQYKGVYRKAAGILCRLKGDWFVMGMGINCMQSGFTGSLADTAVSIRMCINVSIPPLQVIHEVLSRLRELLPAADESSERLSAMGADVRTEIEKRLISLGSEVMIRAGRPPDEEIFSAVITGINSDGGLCYKKNRMPKDGGGEDILYAGEVTLPGPVFNKQ